MHPSSKHYIIFEVSEIDKIDFSQVVEDSALTVRRNLPGTHALVKYEGSAPSSVVALTTKSEEYGYSQIMDLLSGDEWTPSEDDLDI
jgi:hypothetical protein